MLVTGSVQVDVDVVLEEEEVVVEHVMAVLAGAAPQEVRPRAATSVSIAASSEPSRASGNPLGDGARRVAYDNRSDRSKRFTVPLLRVCQIPNARCSAASLNPESKVKISNLKFQISNSTTLHFPTVHVRNLKLIVDHANRGPRGSDSVQNVVERRADRVEHQTSRGRHWIADWECGRRARPR